MPSFKDVLMVMQKSELVGCKTLPGGHLAIAIFANFVTTSAYFVCVALQKVQHRRIKKVTEKYYVAIRGPKDTMNKMVK